MKRVYIMPLLVAGLFAAACGGGLTDVDTTPRVRFVNVTTGISGNSGFTANGQFVAASAPGSGQSVQGCAPVAPGTTSFGFGLANAGGTALAGDALMTLNNQTIAAGGNYTLAATGSAASPQLYLIDNSYAGSVGSNQAAVRFLNLTPGPNPIPNIYSVFTAWPPVDGAFAPGVLVGTPSDFKTIASGSTKFWFLIGHQFETLDSAAVTLQAGSAHTFGIIPKTSGGAQLINIPQC